MQNDNRQIPKELIDRLARAGVVRASRGAGRVDLPVIGPRDTRALVARRLA